MTEDTATRLRRLEMRSRRRGIREMDLVLGRFAESLPDLDPETLDLYERLLSENDHDLYRWVSGQEATPKEYSALISKISLLVEQGLNTAN